MNAINVITTLACIALWLIAFGFYIGIDWTLRKMRRERKERAK